MRLEIAASTLAELAALADADALTLADTLACTLCTPRQLPHHPIDAQNEPRARPRRVCPRLLVDHTESRHGAALEAGGERVRRERSAEDL